MSKLKWLLPLIILIYFLPKIAETPLGKPLFIKAIHAKTGADVEIGTLSLSWKGPQIFKEIHFTHDDLKGSIAELQIQAPFWSFSGPFTIKGGVTEQGRFEIAGTAETKESYNLQISLQHVPIPPQYAPILGSTLDCDGNIVMKDGSGEANLDIATPTLKTKLRGVISANAMTIRKAHTIALQPNLPDLQAQQPIVLTIEPNGFSCPIPFNLAKLQIAHGSLDCGKMKVRNNEMLAALLGLLNAPPSGSLVDLWCTLVDFNLESGNLRLGRMDALVANSIHICGWGAVNLIKEKLDLILGLPADTLQKAFGIKSLPERFVLKVPVRGTFEKPEIVKGPAAAQIGALVAGGAVAKKGVWGGLAELITKPKEEKDVPEARRPFPWERGR